MSAIRVHKRISERHPELSQEDVVQAMRTTVAYAQRNTDEWVSVGFDGNGRIIECVYVYNEETDEFGVYHAMTPPSSKTLKELKLSR